MSQHDAHEHGAGRRSKISWLVFIAFAAIAAYFLITEHRAHVFGALPFLLLAACPLLHIFHHGSHGHASDDDRRPPDRTSKPT